MSDNVSITQDDYKEVQQINWNRPVQLPDDKTLINMGEKCPRYQPCPVCRKCGNKASHLFAKCAKCGIPICVHTSKQKAMMIKRDNFAHIISQEAMDAINLMATNVHNQAQVI